MGRSGTVNIGERTNLFTEKYSRLKFALAHGWLPPEVDHIDRDWQNNSLANLRAATRQQNQQNKGPYRRKDAGLPRGVHATKSSPPRFRAQVWMGGKYHSLGTFDTVPEARKVVEDCLGPLHGDRYCPHPLPEGE